MKTNYVDNTIESPALLSICTGRRGLEIGIERAITALRGGGDGRGNILKPTAYVENESVVAYNLVAQMEQGLLAPTPVWPDVKTFPWELFRNKIHILAGGYPCTPFSTAGKQRGADDVRHLFPYIEHGIATIGPICCFFENVVNHLNLGYREVRHSLESLGYKVEEGIFSAEEVGAPHLRKRLFILAVANTYCTEQSKRRGDFAKVFGLQEGQCQSKHCSIVSGRGGEKLEHPDIERRDKTGRCEIRISEPSECDQALGNTEFQGLEGGNGFQKPAITSESGQGVAQGNSFGEGLALRKEQSTWQELQAAQRTSLWPAGQGEYQHPWEHPRLESRLGFTVDGYDFTEDLLRMAGNAVVEQQAELAFRTLLMKFL